jgi:CheY-like chemotaxis protein
MSKKKIKELVIEKVKSEFDPDVVLLDLRLHDSDFIEDKPKKLTGIELLKSIKEINQGIQVIIFTASEKSLILEEALLYGALGYIKKEHPESYNISIEENIRNLISRVSEGFERKFLKDIWNTRNNILDNLNNKSFLQYKTKKDVNKKLFDILKNETHFVFDILNSETKNKNNYAAISMVTWLDALQQIFISEKQKIYYFWDGTDVNDFKSLSNKILSLVKQKMNYSDIQAFETKLTTYVETKRNQYAHSNPNYKLITSEELKEFYNLLFEVLNMIINPKEAKVEEKKTPKSINPNSKLKIKKKKTLD